MASEVDLGIDHLSGAEEIGRGGFSTVYAATDTQLDRRVAVKVLNRLTSDDDRQRFDRECQIMARLSGHPHVVMVHSAGYTSYDYPYLVMELLEGGNLAGELHNRGLIGWRQAIDYVVPICDALAHAHAQGVLHRDVKPENILLDGDGTPHLTDFGVARVRDGAGGTSTQVTASWHHTPPETFDNLRDERSDTYSLASTLHTLITGHPPFWRGSEESLNPLMRRLLDEPAPPVPAGLAPEPLSHVLQQAMAKNPADRPQSIEDLAKQLRHIRSGQASVVAGARGSPSNGSAAAGSGLSTLATQATAAPANLHPPVPPAPAPDWLRTAGASATSPDASHAPAAAPSSPAGGSLPPAAGSSSSRSDGAPRFSAFNARKTVIGMAIAVLVIVGMANRGSDGSPSTVSREGVTPDEIAAVPPLAADVTLVGPQLPAPGADALAGTLQAFSERAGISTELVTATTPGPVPEADLAVDPDAGLALVYQPTTLAALVRDGAAVELRNDVAAQVAATIDGEWLAQGQVGGAQYGVPIEAAPRSLVWYQPARFELLGYEVPQTWTELVSLTEQAAAEGNVPWCVGAEAGAATGWPFTDWVENLVLGRHGPAVYDQWVRGEIPFSDERIVQALADTERLWELDGSVYTPEGQSVSTTPFSASGEHLIDNQCLMLQQAAFYSAFFPESTRFADGSLAAVEVFPFPGSDSPAGAAGLGVNQPLVGTGLLAVALHDRDNVWATLSYLASAGHANERQALQRELQRRDTGAADATGAADGAAGPDDVATSGFLTVAAGVDTGQFSPVEQSMTAIMGTSEAVRFDASEQMPAEVTEAFWLAGTGLVDGQGLTAAEAAATIDAAWPDQ